MLEVYATIHINDKYKNLRSNIKNVGREVLLFME